MSQAPADTLSLVDDDYITRMTGFEADCNDGKGDAMACHQVGEFFSLVKYDRGRASKVYEKNCEKNSYSASCFNLAKLYMTGMGVPQSDQKAENFFKQSCDGGHLYGCYHQRQAAGLAIIEGSCNKGENDSCYLAGSHYISAGAKIRDPVKALGFLDKACTGNHAPSCYNLAVMYRNGDKGVQKDETLFKKYQKRTHDLIEVYGSVDSKKIA